ncbi:hypothetical protein GB931_02515 [Modestobacter sp. I12A-02628]|uniref:Uncharacterized protein n=1 Tax=Goekera deserti TaxID=2497753 RepID=A0A7K3WG21_9ACTN|nr:hypothetical protein [Goekera deserti]MPQ96811.1 hypothetical protein [Goekera deserti]NDI46875.1 hypothetical protein [Goekera deserti]NEL54443.1 hypothetical protein [Goekera deserti]
MTGAAARTGSAPAAVPVRQRAWRWYHSRPRGLRRALDCGGALLFLLVTAGLTTVLGHALHDRPDPAAGLGAGVGGLVGMRIRRSLDARPGAAGVSRRDVARALRVGALPPDHRDRDWLAALAAHRRLLHRGLVISGVVGALFAAFVVAVFTQSGAVWAVPAGAAFCLATAVGEHRRKLRELDRLADVHRG